jgi:integrase
MKNRDGTPSALSGNAAWLRYVEFRLAEGASIDELEADTAAIKAAVLSGYKAKRQSKPRPRGTGCVYQRAGSQYFWAQYAVNGQLVRESTKALTKSEATEYLNRKLREIGAGRALDPDIARTSVSVVVERMFERKKNGQLGRAKSVDLDELRWKANPELFFGKLRVRDVTEDKLTEYVTLRKKELRLPDGKISRGVSNGTVNREIAILRRAFSAAKLPEIEWSNLPEGNPREGFLQDDKRDALLRACGKVGLWFRALVATAATFGFRRGELLNMRVKAFDQSAGVLRLERRETKSGKARTIKLTADLQVLLQACAADKGPDDYLFTRTGKKRDGQFVGDFRKTWVTCCKAAGCPDLIFHDLRRSAIRNMVRSGMSEREAMLISGHRTRAVFDRYDITDESRLAESVGAYEGWLKLQNSYIQPKKAKAAAAAIPGNA